MSARYTEKDLERARRWLDEHSGRSTGRGKRLAELIADVREECAQIAEADESSTGRAIAERIRAGGDP